MSAKPMLIAVLTAAYAYGASPAASAPVGGEQAALKSYVGAALLDSDNGYGVKVMGRLAEFDGAVGRKPAATKEAKADSIEQPSGSIGVGGEKDIAAGSVGM